MMYDICLKSIYPGLAMGAEFAYQCSRQIPGGEATALAAAARLENGAVCLSGTLGQTGVHLCFYRKASEQLQISAEFEANFKVHEAVGTIGYQVRAYMIFFQNADIDVQIICDRQKNFYRLICLQLIWCSVVPLIQTGMHLQYLKLKSAPFL